jgi:hypothetical protein
MKPETLGVLVPNVTPGGVNYQIKRDNIEPIQTTVLTQCIKVPLKVPASISMQNDPLAENGSRAVQGGAP